MTTQRNRPRAWLKGGLRKGNLGAPDLEVVHAHDLPAAILAAAGTGDVGRDHTTALGAGFEERRPPAIGTAAHLALALGHSSLGDGHDSIEE